MLLNIWVLVTCAWREKDCPENGINEIQGARDGGESKDCSPSGQLVLTAKGQSAVTASSI